jgi:hypothetical protein
LARACFAFTLTVVSLLLISDVFVYSWRYQLPALVTLPCAGALAVMYLAGKRARTGAALRPANPATATEQHVQADHGEQFGTEPQDEERLQAAEPGDQPAEVLAEKPGQE